MLEALDDIDWSELRHAYGPATDVPGQLRDLASFDPEVRKKALWHLYGNIFHQGTRYQAAPHAVPFLYELLDAPETQGRHSLVELLGSIAIGYDDAYYPDGLEIAELRRSLEESEAQMTDEERAECKQFGFGPRAELDSYDAVRAGVPTLLRCLENGDIALQRAALYALAWFPEDAHESIPAIERLLAAARDRDDHATIATALLALGLLTRGIGGDPSRLGVGVFLEHESPGVRTAAAIATATQPLTDDVLHVLLAAIEDPTDLQGLKEIPFDEGDLAGYAGLVLSRGGDDTREVAVPTLCRALEVVDTYESLEITRSLLELITTGRSQPIRDVPAEALGPLETRALEAITEHGGWRKKGAVFVNYSELLRAFGVPETKEKLREYLGLSAKPGAQKNLWRRLVD